MKGLTYLLILTITSLLACTACSTVNQHYESEQKRQAILAMHDQTLEQVYQNSTDVQAQIELAPGYAVFNNANINVLVASVSGGYGVLHNNRTGKNTFMNMGELGIGLGAGLKEFKLICVFHTDKAMKRFLKHGWTFGGRAEAVAKTGSRGFASGSEGVTGNVTIYEITESGLVIQATLKGSKHWQSKSLNTYSY